MKKVYSILMLLALSVLSFNALAAKTVSIECDAVEALEVRDGGPEGKVIPVEVSPAKVTFESENLYLNINEDFIVSFLSYTMPDGSSNYVREISMPMTIAAADLMDDGLIEISAQKAKKITLNVPDPSLVTVKYNSYDSNSLTMVEGANTIKLSSYGGFYVGVKDPETWKMTRFYRVSDNKDFKVSQYSYVEMSGIDMEPGDEFSYELTPASEFEAPSFTLTVDKPEIVRVSVDWIDVEGLVANEPKEIVLSSDFASCSVSGSNGNEEIYQVTQNGNVLEAPYGYYNFTVHPNDVVVVTAEFPEVFADINVLVEPAEYAAAIKSVTCANAPVADWSTTFKGQVGKKLNLEFDTNLYKITGVTVNGVAEESVYSSIKKTIPEDGLTVVVSAEKYETLHATVNVVDPETVYAELGYDNKLDLVAGDNEFEFTERSSQLTITPAGGCLLDKVVTIVGSEEKEQDLGWGRVIVNLEDGMVIKVEAHKIELDSKFVLYSVCKSYSYLDENPTWQNIALANSYDRNMLYPFEPGYNFFEFNTSFNPFAFSVYDSNYQTPDTYFYLNGERLVNDWGYNFELADGDVLKFYLTEEPKTYTATFNIAEGCKVDVDKDYITTVDPSAPVSDFEGTVIRVKAADGAVNVLDGDTAITADADGYYCVTLDGDKTINVTAGGSTAVDNVAVDAAAQTDVYTATGVLVLKNATEAQIKALPAGVYVSAGKKFIVR